MPGRLWPGSGDKGGHGSGESQEKVYDLLKLYGPMRQTELAQKFHEERDSNSGITWEENKGNVVRQVGHILRKLAGHDVVHDINQGAKGTSPQWAVKAPAPRAPQGKPKRRGWSGGGKKGQGRRTDLYPDPPKHEPSKGLGKRPEDMKRGRAEDMHQRGGQAHTQETGGDFYDRQRESKSNPENMRKGTGSDKGSQSEPWHERTRPHWEKGGGGQQDSGGGGSTGVLKPASKPADPPKDDGPKDGKLW
jgi:hypothetical protein